MFGLRRKSGLTLAGTILSCLLLAGPALAQPPAVTTAAAAAVITMNQPTNGYQLFGEKREAARPEPAFPRFQLQLSGSPDENLFVLGVNSFTTAQLAQFVLSLSEFLENANALDDNQTLVLRQEGTQGYLALAAARSNGELQFTLTLHAEAPAGVTGDGGVHTLGLQIADLLLAPAE